MADTIILKSSDVVGKVPTAAQLEFAEVALNVKDGALYAKLDDGNETVVNLFDWANRELRDDLNSLSALYWTAVQKPAPVLSVFGRQGDVIAQAGDYSFDQLADLPDTLAGYGILDAAPLDSAPLTGAPTAPTPGAGNNSTRLATTAFVQGELNTRATGYVNVAQTQTVTGRKTFQNHLDGGLVNNKMMSLANFIADLHPESTTGTFTLPFLSNDLAYLTQRGGTCTTNHPTLPNGSDLWFDGSPSYGYIDKATIPAEGLVITVTFPQVQTWGVRVGIHFGAEAWMADDIKLEARRANDQVWVVVDDTVGWTRAAYQVQAGINGSAGIDAIRFTLKSWTHSGARIAQIWALGYASTLSKMVFMGRDGGDLYGPLKLNNLSPNSFVKLDSNKNLIERSTAQMLADLGINPNDGPRIVGSTASGAAGVEDGANTWAKLATYSCPSQFSDSTFIYAVNNSGSAQACTAMISVYVRANGTGVAPFLEVAYLSAHGGNVLADDSFKLIANATHTGFELWIKKTGTYCGFTLAELGRKMGPGNTAVYYTNSPWQSAEPVGSVLNASSNGLRFRGQAIFHTGNFDPNYYMLKAGGTFTGKVNTAASAVGGAGLNLPHGAAPTAPVNGDFWTTTTGPFVQINGATKQLAATDNWVIPSQAEAQAGTATTARVWTAERVAQAIAAKASPLGHSHAITDVTGLGTALADRALAITGDSAMTTGLWKENVDTFGASGTVTGALVIRTPFTGVSMVQFRLKGYQYHSVGSWEYLIGSYKYNLVGSYQRHGELDLPVYVAIDQNGKHVWIIGNDDTAWNYPKISLDAMLGHTEVTAATFGEITLELVADTSAYTSKTAIPQRQTLPFSQLIGRPTTLAGYGITDAMPSSSYTVKVGDLRASGDLAPNGYADQSVTFSFTDDLAGVSPNWASAMTVRGWNASYQTWQLYSTAGSGLGETELYFRTGANTTWNPPRKVWTEGNFTPANKLDVSAYTAADVLAKVKTVDGAGSGLDADLLDGLESSSFVRSNNGSQTIGSGVTNQDVILSIANPGVGYQSGFNFQKASDGAGVSVTEYSNDATLYEMWMSDNPDSTLDIFSWRFTDWQGVNSTYQPLQIANLESRFIGSNMRLYTSLQQPAAAFFTTGDPTKTNNTKYINYINDVAKLKLSGSGTVTITALNVTGYNSTNGRSMWLRLLSATTFEWGYGSPGGTPTPVETGLAVSTSPVALSNGITVTFSSTSTGVAGDLFQWRTYARPTNLLNDTSFNGAVTVSNGLSVASGGLSVNGGGAATFSGNASVAGTLAVTGAATFSGQVVLNQYSGGLKFNSFNGGLFFAHGPGGAGDNVFTLQQVGSSNYNLSMHGKLQVNGSDVWHSGTFNPADKANVADPTFTTRVTINQGNVTNQAGFVLDNMGAGTSGIRLNRASGGILELGNLFGSPFAMRSTNRSLRFERVGGAYDTATHSFLFNHDQPAAKVVAIKAAVNQTGRLLEFQDSADNPLSHVAADGTFHVGSNPVWHAGTFDPATKLNTTAYTAADVFAKVLTLDGAGSGLDADLLDGQDSSYYTGLINAKLDKVNGTATDTLRVASAGSATFTIEADSDNLTESDVATLVLGQDGLATQARVGLDQTNHFYIQPSAVGVGNDYINRMNQAGAVYKVWDAGNDGAGSGLDADLLDGLNSTEFLRSNNANAYDLILSANDGRGVRFWTSDEYKIHMSHASNATFGGRIAGDTTSDYNLYFRMGLSTAGVNRGFVFENNHGTKLFSINPDRVRSNAPVQAPGFIGALTGNADTATKLTTARSIALTGVITAAGVDFDGSAGISLTTAIADDALSIAKTSGLQTALDNRVLTSQIGAVSGIAPLGADQKVPAQYLPSYVDDVLEYTNFAAFPATGESGKLYVALDNNTLWRWTGTVYVDISSTSGNADTATRWSTARTLTLSGKVSGSATFDGSADIALNVTGLSGSKADVGLGNVDNTSDADKPVSTAQAAAIGAKLDATAYTAADVLTKVKTVDGAASGLDADLLDGVEGANYVRADLTYLGRTGSQGLDSTTNTAAAWSNLPAGYSRMMHNTVGIAGGAPVNSYGYFHKIAQRDSSGGWAGLWAGYTAGQNYIGRAATNADFATWDKLWSDANDGAGSGLDADLLDGYHGSFYRDASNLDAGTVPDVRLSINVPLKNAANVYAADQRIQKDNAWFTVQSSNAGGNGVEQGAGISIGESGYKGTAALHLTYTGDGYSYIGMGVVDAVTGIPTYPAMRMQYQTQELMFYTTPKVNANVVWHAGNDGASSGLDADLLDGQQGSWYQNAGNLNAGTLPDARLSTNVPLKNADNTFTGVQLLSAARTDFMPGSAHVRIEASGADAAAPRIQSYGSKPLYLNELGNPVHVGASGMTIGGNVVWHAGNDGASSGLDADLLDGQHGSFYRDAANLNAGILPVARLPSSVMLNSLTTLSSATAQPTSSLFWTDGGGAQIKAVTNGAGSTGFPTELGATWSFRPLILDTSSNYGRSFDLYRSYGTDDFFFRSYNGSTGVPNQWAKIWTSLTDGAGSTLDADLLDGQEGSWYQSLANSTGLLDVARGGTGINSYTEGSYLRGGAGNTLVQRTAAEVRADIGATTFTMSDTAPLNPNPGDEWVKRSTGVRYTWLVDIDSGQWVDLSSPGVATGPAVQTYLQAEQPATDQPFVWYQSGLGEDGKGFTMWLNIPD